MDCSVVREGWESHTKDPDATLETPLILATAAAMAVEPWGSREVCARVRLAAALLVHGETARTHPTALSPGRSTRRGTTSAKSA